MVDMYIDSSEATENVGQIHFSLEYDFQNTTLILKVIQVSRIVEKMQFSIRIIHELCDNSLGDWGKMKMLAWIRMILYPEFPIRKFLRVFLSFFKIYSYSIEYYWIFFKASEELRKSR